MGDGSGVVWFNAPGLEVLGVSDDGVEVTIAVETAATVVRCPSCGMWTGFGTVPANTGL